MDDWWKLVLIFTIFSMIGWFCESIYCSIPAKKFINRGFLNGPFCPVYGVGGVLVTSLLVPFQENWGILFIAGMLITSIVEYITGFLLEKLFHTKWWDYSQKKFNLHGRVCLKNSLLFGVMSVLVMKVIFPPISRLIDRIPSSWLPVIAVILIVYFAADTYATVRSILQLNGKLAELERALEDLRQRAEEAKKHRLEAFQSAIESRLDNSTKKRLQEMQERQMRIQAAGKLRFRRIINAFPTMHSLRHPESLMAVRRGLEERKQDKKAEKQAKKQQKQTGKKDKLE